MKRTYWIAAALGLALAPSIASPQAPAAQTDATQSPAAVATVPPDQQPTKEQLAKLFEVMRLRQQYASLQTMLPKVIQQQMHAEMRQTMAKLPAAKQLTSAQQSALEDLMNKYMQKALTVYTADEMMSDSVAIYQRHFTRADVDAYIAFYKSPPGQHLLDAQPLINREFMPIVMQHVQERTRQLDAEMEQDLQQFIKSQEQSPAPAAPPPPGK
jgi:uncharacterized protein